MEFEKFSNNDQQADTHLNCAIVPVWFDDCSSTSAARYAKKQRETLLDKVKMEIIEPIRDSHGNLTDYKIGPRGDQTAVVLKYSDATATPPVVSRAELARPNGETIVYERQRDSADANAPFVYTEFRNGMPGDLHYGGLAVSPDGRIDLYFDILRSRRAISFNPTTGGEEYF